MIILHSKEEERRQEKNFNSPTQEEPKFYNLSFLNLKLNPWTHKKKITQEAKPPQNRDSNPTSQPRRSPPRWRPDPPPGHPNHPPERPRPAHPQKRPRHRRSSTRHLSWAAKKKKKKSPKPCKSRAEEEPCRPCRRRAALGRWGSRWAWRWRRRCRWWCPRRRSGRWSRTSRTGPRPACWTARCSAWTFGGCCTWPARGRGGSRFCFLRLGCGIWAWTTLSRRRSGRTRSARLRCSSGKSCRRRSISKGRRTIRSLASIGLSSGWTPSGPPSEPLLPPTSVPESQIRCRKKKKLYKIVVWS